jgi:hypothetical protein
VKVNISDDRQFPIDLDVLLRTRLLIQANSGGGKSYLIRKLAEECFGKVQLLIIDAEGEFATLREKFGFALAGKGGEISTDPRHASHIAEKMLEFHANVVFDLYEMKPYDRPRWVKEFITGLMNAPKELWHPAIIIVDEAHKFCPERGKGEAESTEAMLTLATAGRKRGFCSVFATQRLGKLNKDAAAELLNVLIGRTFLDLDRDRAADILGIQKSGKAQFDETLRNLHPGQFYALGPAISTKPELIMTGKVQTTHPEAGMSMKATKQPPTPEQVKALLPKLADLPKSADEKARTEAELRTEIRSLKAQLSAKPKPEIDEAAVSRAVESALTQRDREHRSQLAGFQSVIEKMQTAMSNIGKTASQFVEIELPKERHAPVNVEIPSQRLTKPAQKPTPLYTPTSSSKPSGDMSGPEQRILDAIAWLNSIGVDDPEQTAVAFLAGYTIGGGAFNNPRGRLNQRGLVQYVSGDKIRLTEEGRRYANTPTTALDADELQRVVLERLPGPEQKILRVLLNSYPDSLTNEECASQAGYAHGGGAYNNPRGRLRSLGLIDYQNGKVVAKPLLFLEN